MKEILKTNVVMPDGSKNEEGELELQYEDESITITIDGKEVCSLDWNYNFALVAERGLELWGKPPV